MTTRRTSEPFTVSIAHIDTGYFSFMAVGATPDEAIDALMGAWRVHVASTGADPDYVTREDINVMTGPLGQAFRDGSPYPKNRDDSRNE